jgi:hypothetical protein
MRILNIIGMYGIGEKNKYGINPLYTTIDVSDSDYNMILSEDSKLPIPSNKARIIYSAHNLEHLPWEVIHNFIIEIKRCLRDSGELLLELPDCEYLYNIYKNKKWESPILPGSTISFHEYFKIEHDDLPFLTFLNSLIFYIDPPFIGRAKTVNISEDVFNQNFTNLNMKEFFNFCTNLLDEKTRISGGHVTILYDENIVRLLKSHGFDVKIRKYKKSRYFKYLGRFLIPDRKHRSFYSFRISATKS